MPTYEYACRSCGAQLEVVQSFTDDPLTTCGVCGGALRKVFGAVGISFKGSGFYKTDSRKGSSTTSAAKSGETAGGADGGASTGGSDGATKEPASTSGGGGDGAISPKATPATPPKPTPTSTT